MKFCKDCKHFVWPPYPLQNAFGAVAYREPMCGHPDAPRSVVTGNLTKECARARYGIDLEAICGMDAKLFEETPPAPEPEPLKPYGQIDPVERRVSFWKRLFGG